MRAICEDHAGGREMEEVDYPPDAYVAPDNPVKRVMQALAEASESDSERKAANATDE